MSYNAQLQGAFVMKLSDTLRAGGYSERTVRNYNSEVRFLFSYFNDLDPLSISQDHIIVYINSARNRFIDPYRRS